MKLRTNEMCPIHRSVSCGGRELIPKVKLIRLGVQRIEDPHHARGYRELRSPAEMKKLQNRKVAEQNEILLSARNYSPTTTMWCPITKHRRGSEGRGVTITRTISKQRIGGATKKKAHREWATDG
jgi:hypothetical protein